MNDINTDEEKSGTKWFIDADWFEQNNRSLSVLIRGCLCPKCYQRFKPDSQAVSTDRLIKTIKDCCSKTTDFIITRTPVLESVFRLLLANGNQPVALKDIVQQLGERCGVGLYRLSPVALYTLMNNDQYYGLSQIIKS